MVNFILYENKWDKIIANNHQFLGVNNAIERFEDRKNLYDKLGVFWHNQGERVIIVMGARFVVISRVSGTFNIYISCIV